MAGTETLDPSLPRNDSVLVGGDASSRVGGYVVDSAIVSAGSLVLLTVLAVIHGPVIEFERSGEFSDRVELDGLWFAIDTAAVTLFAGIYFAGSWVRSGATIGQRAVGLRVLPADASDGTNGADGVATLTAGRAVARYLALGVPLWLAAGFTSGNVRLAFWCLGALWYAVLLVSVVKGSSTVGIHDRIARTMVVRRVTPLRSLDHPRSEPYPE